MSATVKTVRFDPTNPQTAFERELVEAGDHAEQYLMVAYQKCMDCGLNTSLAKSQGVLWACTRVLAHHLIQHLANQMATPEVLESELLNIQRNLASITEAVYPDALAESLASYAASVTKQ